MNKILSLLISVSLILSSIAPSWAQIVSHAPLVETEQTSLLQDIDPLGVFLKKGESSVQQFQQDYSTTEEIKKKLDAFSGQLNNNAKDTEADGKAEFKQAYLAELSANRKALEAEFGSPLPADILKELKKLGKDTEIEKAWQRQEAETTQELASMANLIFQLYDIPGEKPAAIKYMYTLFPVLSGALTPEERQKGLAIMRNLVLTNAASCEKVGTWTGIKAFFGVDADLMDAQTRCEQALAAAHLLPVLGDFTTEESEDVKAVATLFAHGFQGSSSVLIIQAIGGMLLEAGMTKSLASVLLAAIGTDGASKGLFIADYTPDFSSFAAYIRNSGDGFSKGFDESYYPTPNKSNSNLRNAWTDLGRAWGSIRGNTQDDDLNSVLNAAVTSTNPNDVKFKPFVTGVLASGYIYKNKAFVKELAQKLFLMDKGDLNPYTATYMENLLAVAYHKAGGEDKHYNTLVAQYKGVPPLTAENYWTCSFDMPRGIPPEELPERVICQWAEPSTAQLKEELGGALFSAFAACLDSVLVFVSFGSLIGVTAYKIIAGAGKLLGQGAKWGKMSLRWYVKARNAWRQSKVLYLMNQTKYMVGSASRKALHWGLVKPAEKFFGPIVRLRRKAILAGANVSGSGRFASSFLEKKLWRTLSEELQKRGYGPFADLASLAQAAVRDSRLQTEIKAAINNLNPKTKMTFVKSWAARDQFRTTEIDQIISSLGDSFGEQFTELLVGYANSPQLRNLLGDYVFVEFHNGRLVLGTERKAGAVFSSAKVADFVSEPFVRPGGTRFPTKSDAELRFIFIEGSDKKYVSFADLQSYVQGHPGAVYDKPIWRTQRIEMNPKTGKESIITKYNDLTNAEKRFSDLNNLDKTLKELNTVPLNTRKFLDLTAGSDNPLETLGNLRKKMQEFTPEVDAFLSTQLPQGTKYKVRYNYRVVEHEITEGVLGHRSSNMHMHLEAYVEDLDVLYNFNIPVKLSDSALDNLKTMWNEWESSTSSIFGKLFSSKYSEGRSLLLFPVQQQWKKGAFLVGGVAGAGLLGLVAGLNGFEEDEEEHIVGETMPGPERASPSNGEDIDMLELLNE